MELREHLTDLISRERTNGADAGSATAKARTIMGSDGQLVQAMLDRSPPRALCVKAPWAVFGVLPVVGIFVLLWLIGMTMMRLTIQMQGMPSDMPASYQTLLAAVSLFATYLLGPLAAAACVAVALRQRLTSAWVWTGLILIALLCGLFGFYTPSAPRMPYHLATIAYVDGHPSVAASLGLIALRAGVLFVLAALATGAGAPKDRQASDNLYYKRAAMTKRSLRGAMALALLLTFPALAQMPPSPVAVPLDQKSADSFAGYYKLGPGLAMRFYREDAHFYFNTVGTPQKAETVPVASNKFAYLNGVVTMTFTPGADGKINSVIINQAGRDITAPRRPEEAANAWPRRPRPPAGGAHRGGC